MTPAERLNHPAASPPLVDVRGVVMDYPGVRALDRVSFDLARGEIHALMGENGAGKSTLVKILAGRQRPTAGTIRLGGTEIRPASTRHAEAHGVSTVFQEIDLVPTLSVADNICLGREPTRLGLVRRPRLRARAAAALRRLGIAISVNAPNDRVRDAIMPVNRKWNMAQLQEVLIDFPRSGNVPIMIEYVLIPGVNDADQHADELVEFVRPLHCAVNIIPYNPRRDSPWPAPEEADVERFANRVKSAGVFTKRRRTKGRDQMAACGQLGTQHIRGRKMIELTTGETDQA